ncbi:MAG TPA: hypothetical protein VFP12_09080 [Allosphingosinicella sp.]|nr:hypothetical protein [Allosphingosinicella sp.]
MMRRALDPNFTAFAAGGIGPLRLAVALTCFLSTVGDDVAEAVEARLTPDGRAPS